MSARRPALAIFVALVALAARVAADEPPPSDSGDTGQPIAGAPGGDSPGELRLTGEQLVERGAGNLAEALALLPDVNLRVGGRGDVMLDLRSARQRAILLRIDGVPMNEPWYGIYDLTSIPVTDIVEIRLLVTPASPLDGIGGSGGIIDVVTRAATGAPGAWADTLASTAPGWRASASARGEVGGIFARLSATATGEDRRLDAVLPDGTTTTLPEAAFGAAAALRLEKPFTGGAIGALVSVDTARRMLPPDEDEPSQVTRLDGETHLRVALDGRAEAGGWRFAGVAYLETASESRLQYADATLAAANGEERLGSDVSGGEARATRNFGGLAVIVSAALSSEHARDVAIDGAVGAGRATVVQTGAGVAWTVADGVKVDASAGAATAQLATSAAWPEGELAIAWTPLRSPSRSLELRLLGARKGRLPTLRERFDPDYADPTLRPEIADEAEARATFTSDLVSARADAYVRETEDMIRFNDAHTMRVNVGETTVWGVDARVDVAARPVGGGAAWSHIAAGTDSIALGALDNIPGDRVDGWLDGGWRSYGAWARGSWVGARSNEGLMLAAFFQCDAALWAKFHDYRISLRGENLGDDRHLELSGLRVSGRTFIVSLDAHWK